VANPPQAQPDGILAVGAVVLDREGRVLLIRRAHPPSAGAWTLPGGRVEPGESTEAAIVREVMEETALETHVRCSLGLVRITREGLSFHIHEYLVVPVDDRCPRAGDDAAEVRWAFRSELAALGVHPEALAVIDRGLAEARAP
jgi:ADP-ribose pyrophosphatase YjhB (NUDIX family)